MRLGRVFFLAAAAVSAGATASRVPVGCTLSQACPFACSGKWRSVRAQSTPAHPWSLRLRGGSTGDAALDTRLLALINQAPVVVFMKGEPDAPQCGFSRQIVELLSEHGVAFSHFDILEDDDVRQGLKKLSNWPTYPQVYAHGELLGGLDVCKDLAETGELAGIAHTCKDEAADAAGAGTEGAVSGAVLEAKVSAALDASLVQAVDESDGCGAKFSLLVVSNKFAGMPQIDRQRAVHDAIREELPRIHAITLKCRTEEQWQRQSVQ